MTKHAGSCKTPRVFRAVNHHWSRCFSDRRVPAELTGYWFHQPYQKQKHPKVPHSAEDVLVNYQPAFSLYLWILVTVCVWQCVSICVSRERVCVCVCVIWCTSLAGLCHIHVWQHLHNIIVPLSFNAICKRGVCVCCQGLERFPACKCCCVHQ